MAQWIKPPIAKPDDLNLLPGTYMIERDTRSFFLTSECFGMPLNVPLEANVSLPSHMGSLLRSPPLPTGKSRNIFHKKSQGFPLKNDLRHLYNLLSSLEGANCVSSTSFVCAMFPWYRQLYFSPPSKERPVLNFFPRPLSLHVYTASTMSLEPESHQLHFKSFKYIVEAILKSHLFLLSSLQLLTLTPGIRQLDQ